MSRSVDFVNEALHKIGLPFQGTAPGTLDATQLVVSAADAVGLTLPKTSLEIYGLCVSKGTILDVAIAEYMRGALLFEEASGLRYIGISMGNGEVIEARSNSYAVVDFNLPGRRWNIAALIPDMEY